MIFRPLAARHLNTEHPKQKLGEPLSIEWYVYIVQ